MGSPACLLTPSSSPGTRPSSPRARSPSTSARRDSSCSATAPGSVGRREPGQGLPSSAVRIRHFRLVNKFSTETLLSLISNFKYRVRLHGFIFLRKGGRGYGNTRQDKDYHDYGGILPITGW